MPDLDAAIRAYLSEGSDYEDTVTSWEKVCAAITSTLDYHRPMPSDVSDEVICTCLVDSDDHWMAHQYPCSTVRRIAKALGIEVDDA